MITMERKDGRYVVVIDIAAETTLSDLPPRLRTQLFREKFTQALWLAETAYSRLSK